MDLFPAIDLLGGRCVRLRQGDYTQQTVYGDDPVAVARAFEDAKAPWVHLVDLDAARTGAPGNRPLIAAVVDAVEVPIQVGGGVRDDTAAEALFELGVERVVVGTAALEDPGWVRRLAARRPGRVAVGLDARGRELAVRGWVEGSGHDLVETARTFDDVGVASLVVTEIGRDGMLTGPALDQLAAVLAATSSGVIASGGVGSLADLRALRDLEVDERCLAGAIVGRALYEGAFTVAEAVEASRGPADRRGHGSSGPAPKAPRAGGTASSSRRRSRRRRADVTYPRSL